MVFAARCLSERLWGSAGASEPPPSLHGEKGRKEEVSLGEWLAPCLIMLWLYLEGESEAASKRSALLSSLHRGAEREGVWLFFQQTAWFAGVSFSPLHFWLYLGQTVSWGTSVAFKIAT